MLMANTFSQLYVQIVFAVKHRNALILHSWEEQLYRYITGIVQNKGQKMIAINGMSNHIHLFIGMKPDSSISDLVREIKKSSTNFINENRLSTSKFQWQEGFGAFSYGHSQIDVVAKYVMNQKEHHKTKTFQDEYTEFLKKFQVDYNENYLFDWIEDSN